MNTKVNNKSNELVSILSDKTGWNLARVRFLAAFICSLCKLQTVCYVKLAQDLSPTAKFESNLRRIQRFFADFIVDSNLIAKIIFSMLPSEPPYRLSLDRTNWKFGATNINILMISICHQGVGIPLIWSMLDKRGNSNEQERKDLLDRYIKLFGHKSIESIGADREFIGDKWIDDLIKKDMRFFIRIKENMWVNVPGKGNKKAFWLFNSLPLNKAHHYRKIVKLGNNYVYLSGMRTLGKNNKIEFVIIATYQYSTDTLLIYKDRWQIETMFRALKSSGFNFEDTHLSDPERISKLLSLVCIAFIWAYQVGIYRDQNIAPIKIKKHGRRAYSYFKYGLIFIAYALLCNVEPNIQIITKILSCT
ncbi:MAG: IS4 family transposase [Bacteroidota bacterium]